MAFASRFGWVLALTLVAASVAVAPPSRASGGGGGGGGMSTPSPSARGPDPAKAYQDGVAALTAHDYATAAAKFRIAADAAPRDPLINYAYGLALVGSGDMRAARRPLERAVHGDNPRPDARKNLGLVYLHENEREKATEQLNALATELAACDAACGDQRRAQLQTAHDALKQALEAPAAAAPTTGWLLPGPAEGRAAYAEGVAMVNQARYEEALAAFSRTEAAIGPHPDVLNYLGFVNRKLGRYDIAVSYYQAALSIDPGHRGATEYLGELYLEVGRFAEARRQLAKLDTLCPYGCAEREELSRWVAAGR